MGVLIAQKHIQLDMQNLTHDFFFKLVVKLDFQFVNSLVVSLSVNLRQCDHAKAE